MIRLYDLDFSALEAVLAGGGASPVHAAEVWRLLYRQGVARFDRVDTATTLPRALRERLAAEAFCYVPPVLARWESADGAARKDLLEMEDGERVEVVCMRYGQRYSACLSTQVGCACGCPFCATGQTGFTRQLSSAEIIAQALHMRRELAADGRRLSNIVLMGMGEPLLNYEATMAAVRRLVDHRGWGFPERRITLSTAGIAPEIERLAGEEPHINLAVSLHAATDELRDRLVPINRRYPLDELFAALRKYTALTRRHVLLEWLMLGGVNDAPEQVAALVARLRDCPAHVNLIQFNPTPAYEGRPWSDEALAAFTAALDEAHIPHTVRQRRGDSIAAGCGQLRRRTLTP